MRIEAREAISMNSLSRTRQVALILAAAPMAWFAVYMSWQVCLQVVQTVVAKVAETAATRL
jgi:hypothetical protein